ncbi:MAG: hemerythrin domain-containing protein [Thiogranum sp.]|nr:hemerythrin domain-containing protein [Thiogranum sp.]
MADPAPDFNDPLGLLLACHQRILSRCEMLEKLVPHIAEHGVDNEARSTIRNISQYFSTAAVHHTQDEEVDLFPVLNRQSLKLADIVYRLHKQHAELQILQDRILAALKNSSALPGNADFADAVGQFCALYREHIKSEEKELFSIARHILSSQQIEDLGDAMARRRRVRRLP